MIAGLCFTCRAYLMTNGQCPNGCSQPGDNTWQSDGTDKKQKDNCHECEFYRQQYKPFCANCGSKIVNLPI